jgi:hypothetical protein
VIEVRDLRHASPEDVGAWADHISQNLRRCDRDEVEAMAAVPPADAVRVSVELSSHGYVVLDGTGQPIAMFGAAPHPLPGVGVVWMLGTDGMNRARTAIARATRRYFDELNAAYRVLFNYIDNRNTRSLRWLKWGGFGFLGDWTINGHPFHIFARVN